MKISIIGLGYVGLPLAIEFAKYYYTVGFDIDRDRIAELKKNNDINKEVKKLKINKRLVLTSNKKNIDNSDFFIVTVPTPIYKNKKPNLTSLINASKLIGHYIKKNNIVVFESTVYPGVTENICAKEISNISNLKLNKDFFIGYSPERINPGDKKNTLTNINKIISASNKKSLNKIYKIYKKIIKANVIKAESIKIAEGAKIIENAQRDINIAFMNELKIIFEKQKIDFNKVLNVASSKWNFLNFTPGLVGGHCIGIDPYYLHYYALKNGYKSKIVLAGRQINDYMPKYIFKTFIKSFEAFRSTNNLKKNKILFLGITFKKNVNDTRNSKSIELLKMLNKKFKIDVCDPLINDRKISVSNFKMINLNKINIDNYGAIIYAVNHDKFSIIKKNIKNKNIFIFNINR